MLLPLYAKWQSRAKDTPAAGASDRFVCVLQAEHARGFMEEKFIRPLEAIKVSDFSGKQLCICRLNKCVCKQTTL